MDTIENLIIAIVKPLISQPDALTIKIEDTPEFLEYHLDLDQSDVGRVIGRKGRTISAVSYTHLDVYKRQVLKMFVMMSLRRPSTSSRVHERRRLFWLISSADTATPPALAALAGP